GHHVRRIKQYQVHQVYQTGSPTSLEAPNKKDDRLEYLVDEVKSLRHRVQRLEDQVERLRYGKNTADLNDKPQDWFCSIEAQNKIYRGTGTSKAQAKAKTLDQCEKNHRSFWCSESDVKCEQYLLAVHANYYF
ncbi:MAG: hypothetical protein J6Y94_04615, partial [Bacteriovoracaceae bacterium]|nr:hypothetical protein [Bacteriovoracaceae bacterium]